MWLTQCPPEIYAVVYAGPEEHFEQLVADLTVLRSVSAQHPCAGTHKELLLFVPYTQSYKILKAGEVTGISQQL